MNGHFTPLFVSFTVVDKDKIKNTKEVKKNGDLLYNW